MSAAETVAWHEGLYGQETAVRTLQGLLEAGGGGRFVLFHGPRGVGKGTAARRLAAAMLHPDGPLVRSTEGISARPADHPDAALMEPEKAGGSIKVATVREAAAQAHYPPLTAPLRVWLVDPMDALTEGAANALLRILEEPPKRLWILGVAHNLSMVPITLRSRGYKVPFRLLGAEALAAITGSEDPRATAAGTTVRAGLLADPAFQRAAEQWRELLEARWYDPDAPVKLARGLKGVADGLRGFFVGILTAMAEAPIAEGAGSGYHVSFELEERAVLLQAIADLDANLNPSFVCEETVRRIRQLRKAAGRA